MSGIVNRLNKVISRLVNALSIAIKFVYPPGLVWYYVEVFIINFNRAIHLKRIVYIHLNLATFWIKVTMIFIDI